MATTIDNLGVQFRAIHKNNWKLENAQDNIFYCVQNGDSSFDLYIGKQLLSNQDEINAAVARIGANESAIQELQTLTDGFGTSTIKTYIDNAITALDSGTLAQKVAANEAAIASIKNEEIPGAINTANEAADTKIATFKTNTVDPLAARLTEAEGDIDNLETTVGEHATKIKDLEGTVAEHSTDIGTLKSNVNTLINEDTGKSVRTIAAEELAAQLIPDNANESLDTLQDIAAWIQEHPNDAAEMNQRIQTNTTDISNIKDGTTEVAKAKNADTLDGKDSSYFAVSSEVAAALENKANSADVYTKTKTDELLDEKADKGTSYTKAEADAKLATKANSADVYTKIETDEKLDAKADSEDVYTKAEVNAELTKKANTSTTLAGYGIEDAYTKNEVYTKTETSNVATSAASIAASTAKTELIGNTNDVEDNTPPTLYSVKNYATSAAAAALSEAKKYSDAQLTNALTWVALTSM